MSVVLPEVFLGKLLLVVQIVHYQTSTLKMLVMILMMKQIVLFLKQSRVYLPKAKGIKKARLCEQIAQYVGSNEEKNLNIQYLIFLFLFIIFFIYQIL